MVALCDDQASSASFVECVVDVACIKTPSTLYLQRGKSAAVLVVFSTCNNCICIMQSFKHTSFCSKCECANDILVLHVC